MFTHEKASNDTEWTEKKSKALHLYFSFPAPKLDSWEISLFVLFVEQGKWKRASFWYVQSNVTRWSERAALLTINKLIFLFIRALEHA